MVRAQLGGEAGGLAIPYRRSMSSHKTRPDPNPWSRAKYRENAFGAPKAMARFAAALAEAGLPEWLAQHSRGKAARLNET